MPAPEEAAMPTNDTSTKRARRIVIVGGGIGGAEAALTMAIGLPDAEVTLVSRWSSIRILPDLVYVPFGVSPRRIDVPVAELLPHGVRSIVAEVEHVDARRRELHTSTGRIPFDVLVAAPGAEPRAGYRSSLRTLDDAHRLRRELAQLVHDAHEGRRSTITIRAESDDSWTAPAVELSLLMGAWIRSRGIGNRIETLLVTPDSNAFEWFGPVGEATVDAAMRRNRVQVATGVPLGAFDGLGGDLVVDFGALQPRAIDGLPGLGRSGWYEPDSAFEVAPGIHVVGDAIRLPYRAGFATAWQSRQVLRALGGDPRTLGLTIDGIPADAVEYQMDLADSVLRARLEHADSLAHPFLGHDADIEVSPGGRPDKLQGLLLHDRVLRWNNHLHDAPLAFRDALRAHPEAASA
jgi:hypothetical protein